LSTAVVGLLREHVLRLVSNDVTTFGFGCLLLFGNRRWQTPSLLLLKWTLIWRWRRSKFKPKSS